MNKNQLLNILYAWKRSAVYNIFAQQSLHEYFKQQHKNNDIPFVLPGVKLIDGTTMPLMDFIQETNRVGKKELLQAKREASAFVTRNWLKETFRFVQANLHRNIKTATWYEFARIYVNSVSHDFRYKFGKKDREKLPVSYKNETITIDMDGTHSALKLQTAFELVEEIIAFVRDTE